ncbi:hypothetical protein Q4566_01050 [Tamlana sp. 2_MG-2023]|uniref:hypothetical protein n=1 Tax=unclassified Tamlana TaxID=2614803 RepID=UPI0026E33981|nr:MULTISPECIES: hypothetical protein [unclassified Tamlana]MDO6758770.1 hypothetical protein [Tamlana sp. 2_MG-2023]MDO6789469.1 hypothetical protein [Tamlana sp. 1_MG-2023]
MKPLLIIVVFVLVSCETKNKTESNIDNIKTSELALFGVWHKLTENAQEEFIIYSPCDVLNTTISVNDEERTITVNYGIETLSYTYSSFKEKEGDVTFEGVKFFNQEIENISLKLYSDTGTWYLPDDFEVISTKNIENYITVKEDYNHEKITIKAQIEDYNKIGFLLLEEYVYDINNDGENDAFLVFKEKQSNDYLLSILINENGDFNIWKQSNNIISNVEASGCPAEGFSNITFKNNSFTIEESLCDGWLFVANSITFKYAKPTQDIYLYKQVLNYTDRRNPNKELPEKIFTQEQFGEVSFKEYDNTNLNWVR